MTSLIVCSDILTPPLDLTGIWPHRAAGKFLASSGYVALGTVVRPDGLVMNQDESQEVCYMIIVLFEYLSWLLGSKPEHLSMIAVNVRVECQNGSKSFAASRQYTIQGQIFCLLNVPASGDSNMHLCQENEVNTVDNS